MILHATGYHKGEIEFFKEKPEETELKTKCTECDLRFISENSLRYHKIKIHYPVKDLNCTLCDREFKNLTAATVHKIRIHGNELDAFNSNLDTAKKGYDCTKCKLKFFTT